MRAWLVLHRLRFVLAFFCFLVVGLLAWNLYLSRSYDPLEATRLEQMQLRLAANPSDERLRGELRELDRQVRQGYFRHRQIALQGLLLLGVLVFALLATHSFLETVRPRTYEPEPDAATLLAESRRKAAQGAYGLTILLGGLLAVLATVARNDPLAAYATRGIALDSSKKETSKPDTREGSPLGDLLPANPSVLASPPLAGAIGTQPASTSLEPVLPSTTAAAQGQGSRPSMVRSPASLPSLEPYLPPGLTDQWPRFRGPAGTGVALGKPPLPGQGLKIVWKKQLGLPGWNSPIVVASKVLLAMADDRTRVVAAFDADSGAEIWRTSLPYAQPAPKVSSDTGYAPSTMASDGERAYVVFPDGLVAAISLDGSLLWTRSFGPLENSYGHASSLLCYEGLVIVQLDQGHDPEEKVSQIVALQGASGETRWQVQRAVSASWTTPVLLRVDGRVLLVAVAPPAIAAYEPANGREVWTLRGLGGEPAPCPTFDEHRLYAGVMGSYLFAIDPSGEGDRTEAGVLWDTSDHLPDIVSPLAVNGLLFLIGPDGTLAALHAGTGNLAWEHHIGPTKASPVFGSGHVWVVTDQGDLIVFPPQASYREAGRLALGETVRASPAIVGDRLYVRGKDHLFCLGP